MQFTIAQNTLKIFDSFFLDYSDDESYSRAPSDRGMSEFTIPQDVVIESRGASR